MAVMPTVEGTTRPVNFWASWSSTVGPYCRGWVTAPVVAMASVNAGSWPTTSAAPTQAQSASRSSSMAELTSPSCDISR